MGGFLSHLKPEQNSEVLPATCGPVRGNIYKHKNDVIVDGFLGIPYAKPPVDELRFKKPIPADTWKEARNCYEYGPACVQTGGFEGIAGPRQKTPEEAGCLTLNVFTPRGQSAEFKSGRPVMVFIHGGGYELCGSCDYCDYSLSGTLPLKDVIVVTVNYRLGVFGFLTTDDDSCRGNMGLWDQTLALRWVQKHISSFGGDPYCVTVFGQSAGASSTDLLSLSPHSRDLFRRFIPISGSAHSDFALRTSENQAKIFREFAEFHGFTGGDSKVLFNWYQTQPAETLSNVKNFKKSISGFLTFIPNFDGDFFPKPLDELRKEAPKKQMMTGVTEYEGLMMAMINPTLSPADNGIKLLAKESYGKDVVSNPDETQRMFYENYTKEVDASDEFAMKKKLIEAFGDEYFNFGVLQAAKSAAKYGNDVYLYTFNYTNPDGFGMWNDMLPFKAALHGTELRYILGEGAYSKFDPNEEDLKVLEKMTTLFSNFAKYGYASKKNKRTNSTSEIQTEKIQMDGRNIVWTILNDIITSLIHPVK
ncbi:hypothetical protein GCK72_019685 [Caenorhabditis remanei]|uniref:Carboxylic ester hydrolase n=1 Tax=Caenorhabditis remanei TaxID=31234 RepID=A0A6A5GFD4_CAERE|nr:hypothetical protein GCK72_019685 [Caenorhabditis remanei]KAF1753129.1 hypothetical protein GCK72_019685 [Caenorhabditis remanei]